MTAEEQLAKNHAEWKAKVHANGQRLHKEWIGATPDTPVPPRVALRITDTWDRKCFLTGVPFGPIKPEMEHKWPLHKCRGVNGNRESNLRPVFPQAHKKKTSEEKSARAKADRAATAHMGLKKTKHPIPQAPKPERPTSKLDSIRALGGSEIARRFK